MNDLSAELAVLQPPPATQSRLATRSEVLEHYRRLRAISITHHSGAMKFIASSVLFEQARRLGVAMGRTLVCDSEEEMELVFDLAIYTARQGRSRAIDRYAKAAPQVAGSDEARMLQAMRQSAFSIWAIERHHEEVGLLLTDLLCHRDVWLIDEGLERTGEDGMVFAGRLYRIDGFAMTSGVFVPVNDIMVDDIVAEAGAWCRSDRATFAQDPRLAAALYRSAIANGVMEGVAFE
jgi:hypothetical protein